MFKAFYSARQPMYYTHLLQSVNVGACARNYRHGLKNARGKSAARALNARVRMLSRPRATIAHEIFFTTPQKFVMYHRKC